MVFQVGLTVILLASVIVASCRSEVGVEPKHCAIATLCALDPQLRSKLGPLSSDTKGLMQRFKVLKTRLERRGKGREAELLFVKAAKRTLEPLTTVMASKPSRRLPYRASETPVSQGCWG